MMIVIKCELTNPTRRPFTEVNRNGKRTTPLEFSNSMRCQIQFSKVKTELKTKAGLGDVDHDGFGLVVEITARAVASRRKVVADRNRKEVRTCIYHRLALAFADGSRLCTMDEKGKGCIVHLRDKLPDWLQMKSGHLLRVPVDGDAIAVTPWRRREMSLLSR